MLVETVMIVMIFSFLIGRYIVMPKLVLVREDV